MQQFLENAAAELETSSLNFCAAKKAALKHQCGTKRRANNPISILRTPKKPNVTQKNHFRMSVKNKNQSTHAKCDPRQTAQRFCRSATEMYDLESHHF